MGVENQGGVSFIRAEAATKQWLYQSIQVPNHPGLTNLQGKHLFVASATVLKETSLMGVADLGSFVGVGALGLLLK